MTTLEKLAELQSKVTPCSMALSAFYSECIQTDFAALSAEMDRMRDERDLAQRNFEYYFKRYLSASGKTIAEAEKEWQRNCEKALGENA